MPAAPHTRPDVRHRLGVPDGLPVGEEEVDLDLSNDIIGCREAGARQTQEISASSG